MPAQAPAAPDASRLERYLKAISFANRIELLAQVREPKTIDQLRLTPSEGHADGRPDRPLTRQAIRHHLDKLEDVGMVRVGETKGEDGRSRREYVLDESRLYAVVEELKELLPSGGTELEPFKTDQLPEPPSGRWPEGPKLVLVHGARLGEAFPLQPAVPTGPRGWIVGRDPKADVSLQYDPYVSAQNTEILREGQGSAYRVLDLRTSKNGTYLNGEQLPVGGTAPLDHGDVLQVGSTLLVFHER